MSSYSPLPPSTLVSLNSFDPSPLARQPVYFPADPLAPAACAPVHAPATRTLRGRVAIAGIGESIYYRRGESPDPEFVLACRAIRAACDDAGIDVTDVDGFASYSNDRNEPSRLAAA